MIFDHCSKLFKIDYVHFVYLATTSSLSVLLSITHKKRAFFKMARSKASRKLYLQVDKANKLKKISVNSTTKTKKENNFENFYRQR